MIRTIGHGNRTLDAFLGIVAEAGVDHVVDVRSFPRSRRFPHFDGERLETALADAGAGYTWAGRALGGKRRPGPQARSRHPRLPEGLAAFAEHMNSAAFADALRDLLADEAARGRVALMCAERDARQCHRWLIADYLVLVRGESVRHLASPSDDLAHPVSADARLTDHGALRYDRGATRDLY